MASAIGIVLILSAAGPRCLAATLAGVLRLSFSLPVQFAGDFGAHRSPLVSEDGTPINTLLGSSNRVAMTGRDAHSPTAESNERIHAFFERFLKAGDVP